MSDSKVVERLLVYGEEKFRKLYCKPKEEPKKETEEKEESVSDRYMKRILFDRRYDYLWEPV